MKFEVKNSPIARVTTHCAIVPIFEGGELSAAAAELDKQHQGIVRQLIKRKDIEGKSGQSCLLPLPGDHKLHRVLLLGCGKPVPLTSAAFLQLAQKISAVLRQHPVNDAVLYLDELSVDGRDESWQARVLSQTLRNGDYHFDQHKSKKDKRPHHLQQVTLHSSDRKQQQHYREGINIGCAIADGMRLTRDLGNTPGNVCTPAYLASQARQMAKKYPALRCKILEEAQMRALGMGSLLSVSAGTEQPAKLIVLEYRAGGTAAPHVLVGKGITFDSGGISLKPGAGMDEMKYDMCGAASVLGTLLAICQLKLPLNVVGIIAAAENMPSGRATKPGDIVTAMNGMTIEVLNTDAEGRLVLCDALTYSERFKPRSVIDIATLTGACVVALGTHAHGLYSNQDDMAQELLAAGMEANDRGWHMPLWEEYDKQLKSPFADMANIGGPNGGSITAACFLARFTKKMRWAHLDIAGTAWDKSPKGATGRPVPLLVQYLIQRSASDKLPARQGARSGHKRRP